MTGIELRFEDGAAKDLIDGPETVVHLSNGFRLAVLEGGMKSEKPSIAVVAKLNNGDVVVLETSLAALYTAVDGIRARYGEVRDGMVRES